MVFFRIKCDDHLKKNFDSFIIKFLFFLVKIGLKAELIVNIHKVIQNIFYLHLKLKIFCAFQADYARTNS